jgi:hypothetical protein
MRNQLAIMLAVVAFSAIPSSAVGVIAANNREPEYCYRCAASLPEDTSNYPCNVCWHPVTGPGAVKSCIPYCNGTCSVGLPCGEQALQGTVVQPDGSRLHLALSVMLQREAVSSTESETASIGSGPTIDQFVRDCGKAIAAEPVSQQRLAGRLATLATIAM